MIAVGHQKNQMEFRQYQYAVKWVESFGFRCRGVLTRYCQSLDRLTLRYRVLD